MERNVIHLEKTCEDNKLNGQRLIKYRILVRVYMTKQSGEEIYCRKYNTFTKEQLTRNRNVYSGRACQQNIKKTANLHLFWECCTKQHCPLDTWKWHVHLLNSSSNCGSKPISSILSALTRAR